MTCPHCGVPLVVHTTTGRVLDCTVATVVLAGLEAIRTSAQAPKPVAAPKLHMAKAELK